MQDNKARLRGKSFKTFPKSLRKECSWVFWEEFLVSLLDVSFKWPFTIHLTFWARWHCQFTTATFRTFPELIPSAVGGSVCGPWRDMWWLARTRWGHIGSPGLWDIPKSACFVMNHFGVQTHIWKETGTCYALELRVTTSVWSRYGRVSIWPSFRRKWYLALSAECIS